MRNDRVALAKMHRAFKHWVERNHDYSPACEGCLEGAAFLTIPGYRGAPQPLVDGQ